MELDTTIRTTIEDESVLESEILDSEEIIFTIAEKIAFIRAVLARPQPPNAETPPPLPESVLILEPVIPPATLAIPSPSDHSLSEDSPVPIIPLPQPPSTDRPERHIIPTGISQNVSRLPKLRFGGDSVAVADILGLL